MIKLRHKNIIVTGATSGIGKRLTERLIEEGANVAFCGRSSEKMSHLLDQLDKKATRTYHETFDATEHPKISNFIQNSISSIGEIDMLVNCAGANSARGLVCDIETSDLEKMLNINLIAPFLFMKEICNQSMIKNEKGMIVNVLSTVCDFANEGIGSYTASKAGFNALTKVFRKEVRERGIKVCSIHPGGVDTPFRDTERPLYLNSESVVDAILYILKQDGNACVDELTVRPLIEKNFS